MLAPSVFGSLLGYIWYRIVAVLRDSIGLSLLSCVTARCGRAFCLNYNKEDYYYYYYLVYRQKTKDVGDLTEF